MSKRYGYMGKILVVDLNNNIREEELSVDIARDYIGGYGIGVRMMIERMVAGADPFGPENIFGIGTGPFTLSGVSSTCRFTTMGKSPLTGYWGDANSGGNFAKTLFAVAALGKRVRVVFKIVVAHVLGVGRAFQGTDRPGAVRGHAEPLDPGGVPHPFPLVRVVKVVSPRGLRVVAPAQLGDISPFHSTGIHDDAAEKPP